MFTWSHCILLCLCHYGYTAQEIVSFKMCCIFKPTLVQIMQYSDCLLAHMTSKLYFHDLVSVEKVDKVKLLGLEKFITKKYFLCKIAWKSNLFNSTWNKIVLLFTHLCNGLLIDVSLATINFSLYGVSLQSLKNFGRSHKAILGLQ